MPYSATDADIAREKADFYARHPDWQHAPVPMDWPGRLVRRWGALLESQNGRDIDDGMVARPHKLERYGAEFFPAARYPRLLILGAGVGREVVIAREVGWNAVGQTLGPRNVAFGREVLGTDLRFEDAHFSGLPGGSFDAIVGMQFLEHSPAPLLALIECARLLRPGGICCMETPPADRWTMGWNLHHVLCPTPRQALGLFAKAGFPRHGVYHSPDLSEVREKHMDNVACDIVTVGWRWIPGPDDVVVEPIVRELTSEANS